MSDLARKIRMTVALLCACGVTSLAADNSLLWKVTAPSGPPSYVFGTIHIPDSNVFMLRDTIRGVLDKSRIFYSELDLDSMVLDASSMQNIMLTDGKTLRSFFNDSDWVYVDRLIASKLGALSGFVSLLKPSAVLMMVVMKSIPNTAHTTIDQYLWQRAGQQKLPRFGIEQMAEQFNVLDQMPSSALADLARDPTSLDSSLVQLRHAYVHERLDLVVEASHELDKYEDFASIINDDRNVRMVDRLTKDLNMGGAFIAVGAAHLPGPQGMLALLQQRGYAVSPVLGGARSNWLR